MLASVPIDAVIKNRPPFFFTGTVNRSGLEIKAM
jgi:hypothetical protein